MWSLNLSKESFKFSSAHFTTFSKTHGENLHGHNYYVSLSINSKKKLVNDMIIDLSAPKALLQNSLLPLDEKILLPEQSSHLTIQHLKQNYEVRFNKKFYSFPALDCVILPVENITIESLAFYISQNLLTALKSMGLISYTVTVEESRGQSSSFTHSFS